MPTTLYDAARQVWDDATEHMIDPSTFKDDEKPMTVTVRESVWLAFVNAVLDETDAEDDS